MLTQVSPHRFQATTTPKVPFGGGPFRSTARGISLPGFALEAYGLDWHHAAGARTERHTLADPLALFTFPQPLWKHQHEDVAEGLLSGAWGEWAAVGLGKTTMVLAAWQTLASEGVLDGVIILGPESASHAWVGPNSDSHAWGIESGLVTDRVKKHGLPACPVLFCNYDKAWREPYQRLLIGLLRTGRWALVLDECHMCQGSGSKRFACVELWSRFVKYLWCLTGTPVSNYPDRLWAVWRLLTKEATSLEEWNLWFRKGDHDWHADRLRQLGRYMKRFSRVRTRKEVSPRLPATTIRTISIPLTGVQRRRYANLLESLADATPREWMGGLQKLLGVCSHPDLLEIGTPLVSPDSKLETLLELLNGLGDAKVVIWSWHPATLAWLARKVPLGSVQYHGGTSEKDRALAVYRFNNDPTIRVFLGNPSAAGAGLNLPGGDGRIYFDSSFHAVQYSQSAGRIERGVNYSPKFEIRLVAQNTVEEACWEAIAKKQNLADVIFKSSSEILRVGKGIAARWH